MAINPMFAGAVEGTKLALGQLTERANAIARQLKSQDNVNAVITDILDTSDDENVVNFRTFLEEWEAKMEEAQKSIEDYVRTELMPAADTEFDADKARAEWKTIRDNVKDFRTVLTTMGLDTEEIDAITKIDSIGRTGSTGAQTGVRRPRIARAEVSTDGGNSWTEIFKEVDGKEAGTKDRKVSLSQVALVLKKNADSDSPEASVTAGSLLEALEAENKEWTDSVSSTFVVGKTAIRVTPVSN